MGDKTPADLVLFASTDLKIDNSSLTGESEPQERFARPDGVQSRPVEAENLVSILSAWEVLSYSLTSSIVVQLDSRCQWRRLGRRVTSVSLFRAHVHRESVVVVRTGDHTMIGQIAALTGTESGKKSPLAVEM